MKAISITLSGRVVVGFAATATNGAVMIVSVEGLTDTYNHIIF